MQPIDDQNAIEKAFLESWDRIERHFTNYRVHWNWLASIHSLIAELRKRGYDHQLRAGQAMVTFILSRSREHGLQNGQSHIWFDLNPDGGMKITYIENNQKTNEFEVKRVELTPEIETLLQRLLAQPID